MDIGEGKRKTLYGFVMDDRPAGRLRCKTSDKPRGRGYVDCGNSGIGGNDSIRMRRRKSGYTLHSKEGTGGLRFKCD